MAKGYNQCPGFEYLEVFAPTVHMPTVRTVLALTAIEDWHLQSIDILSAYLNDEMDVPVYMEEPEGFNQGNCGKIVCLFNKSLYGSKQGG